MNCVSLLNFALEKKTPDAYPKRAAPLKERKNLKNRTHLTFKTALNDDLYDI